MENMNLPSSMILVWDLKRSIEMNQSLHIGIKKFNERSLKCKFAVQFAKWWQNQRAEYVNQSVSSNKSVAQMMKLNMHQRLLIHLIEKGLAGVAIYENLNDLDKQMINSCDDDIEKHISLLPLILQIPLLGMLFPAILMLLLIPALKLLQM